VAVPSYIGRRRSPIGARSFSRSALSGGRVGRPSTNSEYQFAGDRSNLTPEAKQLIAAQGWEQRRGRSKPETAPQNRSISTGGEVSAIRGQYRGERRFAGERGFFSPERGSGQGSPQNPWS